MATVHHHCASFMAVANLEAQQERIASLEEAVRPQKLKDLVNEVCREAAKPHAAESFGLTRPLTAAIDQASIEKRVESIYSEIYSKLDHKLSADARAAEKSKADLEARNAQLLEKTPA